MPVSKVCWVRAPKWLTTPDKLSQRSLTNTQPDALLSIPYVPKTMYYQHNQNASGVVGSDNDIRDSEPKYLESIDTIPGFQDRQPPRKEQDNCNVFPAIP